MPGTRTSTVSGLLLLALTAPAAQAARVHHTVTRHSSNVTLRKRLNINDLIADPGTVEVDLAAQYSYTTNIFDVPAAVRFTPGDRIEFSAAFDGAERDRLTLAATGVVYDRPHFAIAVSPMVTTFFANESGVRAGGTVIGRWESGAHNLGTSLSWSGATTPTDTNPAGLFDWGIGYGRRIGRFTPHVNTVLEKATGFERTWGLFGGVEYEINDRLAFDVSGQRFGWVGGVPDRQLLVGLTVSLGQVR